MGILIDQATVETTGFVGDEDPGAYVERGAFGKRRVVVERSHRVLLTTVGEFPTWRANCRCFTGKISEVYPEEIGCRL